MKYSTRTAPLRQAAVRSLQLVSLGSLLAISATANSALLTVNSNHQGFSQTSAKAAPKAAAAKIKRLAPRQLAARSVPNIQEATLNSFAPVGRAVAVSYRLRPQQSVMNRTPVAFVDQLLQFSPSNLALTSGSYQVFDGTGLGVLNFGQLGTAALNSTFTRNPLAEVFFSSSLVIGNQDTNQDLTYFASGGSDVQSASQIAPAAVTSNTVSEPGIIALFGSMLVLLGLRRRRHA